VTGFDARVSGDAVRFSSRRNVCIVSGLSSRNKMIEVREVDLESVQHLAE